MIHFNFIVDDIDAENIMGCMMESENKCLRKISDLTFEIAVTTDPHVKKNLASRMDWFKSRRGYLKDLMSKMENTRYESPKKD